MMKVTQKYPSSTFIVDGIEGYEGNEHNERNEKDG